MKLEYLFLLPLLPALWLSVLNIYRLLAEDRILRCLYRDHREIWESLGRPNGWQWSPPGRFAVPWRMWSLPIAGQRSDPEWLTRTPELRADLEEIRALRRRMLWPALPMFAAGVVIFAISAHLLQR